MRGLFSRQIERFPAQMHEKQSHRQPFGMDGGVLLEQKKVVGHYRFIHKPKSFLKIKNG
jgi:hypothetical protein